MVLGCASIFVMHLWIVFSIWGQCWNFLLHLQQIKLFVFWSLFDPSFLVGGGSGLRRVEGTMGCMYTIIYIYIYYILQLHTVHVHVYHIVIYVHIMYIHVCVYISWHQTLSSQLSLNWIILAIRVDFLIIPWPQEVAAVGDLGFTRGHANNSTVHLMLDRL